MRWVNLPIEGNVIAPLEPLGGSENNTPSPPTRRFVRWVNLPIEHSPKVPLVKGPRGSETGTPIEEIIIEGRSPYVLSNISTKLLMAHSKY